MKARDDEAMTRLAGDPGVVRWLLFAVGFRLPAENRDWVRHELTDAGWRSRTALRHLAVIIPLLMLGWRLCRDRVMELAAVRDGFTGPYPLVANRPGPGAKDSK